MDVHEERLTVSNVYMYLFERKTTRGGRVRIDVESHGNGLGVEWELER